MDRNAQERRVEPRFPAPQQVIAELGLFALKNPELGRLLDRAVEVLCATLGTEYAKVLQWEPESRTLKLVAGVGWREGLVGSARVDADVDSQGGYTLRTNEPVVVEDFATETRFSPPSLLREHGVASGLSCVINGAEGEAWGALGVHSGSRRLYGADDIYFLQAIANLIGHAVQRCAAEAARGQSEERFRQIAESVDAVFYVTDLPGPRLRYVSPAIRRLWGLEPERLYEDSDCWVNWIHPEDAAATAAAHRAFLDGGEAFDVEYRIRLPDGQERWARDRATVAARDDEGRVTRVTGLVDDITERKRREGNANVLMRIDRVIARSNDPDETAAAALRSLGLHFGAISCCLSQIDPAGEEVRIISDWTPDNQRLTERYRLSEALTSEQRAVLLRGETLAIEEVPCEAAMAALLGGGASKSEMCSVVLAPYLSEGGLTAALKVGVEGRRTWRKDERALLAEVVARLWPAVEVARSQAALRASEARFRNLADNISQFAWTADAEGSIFWYNQRWYDYTGTTLEQMRGWGWRAVHHPDHVDRVVAKLQHSWDTGEPWEDTFPLRGRDGTYRWFLSRAQPIRDETGRVVQWFGTNTDITEQRALEQALRDADRRKDEFLATLAHELRNPLAPIRTAVQVLKLQGPAEPPLQAARDVIDRQVGHMVRLIDDLLDVSRIARDKLELRCERVTLSEVVEQAVESARPLMDAGRHALEINLPTEPVPLEADPMRLAQVFGNLLQNAAKYSEPGQPIRISAERNEDQVVVRVRDEGIGIAPEHLPHLFQIFSQVDSTLDRSQGGLGIGLSLARGLVELHGGEISVRSDGLGRGSTFEVRLPVADGMGEIDERSGEALDGFATARRRVLIVDDNRDAANTLRLLLKALGHDVEAVYGGIHALTRAAASRPEIVLLDLGMPDLNGYETARRLRAQPGGGELMLVALTGWGQEVDRERSREAGFDRHLVKPVDLAMLREVLGETRPTR